MVKAQGASFLPVAKNCSAGRELDWTAIDGRPDCDETLCRRAHRAGASSTAAVRDRRRPAQSDRRDGDLGRGQRELIIGDRQPGRPRSRFTRSSISATRTYRNYNAIGQNNAIAQVVRSREADALGTE